MKMDQLNEVIVLAHYLSFTSAAAKLNISQPNLSKHIAEVEQELGFDLFNRGHNLTLTPAGSEFHQGAIHIHHQYLELVKHCRDTANKTKESLFVQEPYLSDATSEILYKALRRFRAANPYVQAKFLTDTGRKSVESLITGELDIAMTVAYEHSPNIEGESTREALIYYPVVTEPLYLWMPDHHPLTRLESIALDDIVQYPISMTTSRCFDPMRHAVIDLFEHALGAMPAFNTLSSDSLDDFFMQTSNRKSVYLVTRGVAQMPLITMQHDMTVRPVDDPRATITSYLVISESYDKPVIDGFFDALEAVVASEIEQDPLARYVENAPNRP